tara:strand:+ start:22 stop:222 length:201 start_codon:yes stop_codon:yes gene_type:complete
MEYFIEEKGQILTFSSYNSAMAEWRKLCRANTGEFMALAHDNVKICEINVPEKLSNNNCWTTYCDD